MARDLADSSFFHHCEESSKICVKKCKLQMVNLTNLTKKHPIVRSSVQEVEDKWKFDSKMFYLFSDCDNVSMVLKKWKGQF